MAASPNAVQDRQKELEQFLDRRHPVYGTLRPHWDFLEATYEGGRQWFNDNIFQYLKEGDREFYDRLDRAYRFNHTREVVDLVGKYLFKMEITRNNAEAPDSVKRFWKRATLNKASMTDFMKRVANRSSVFGRVYIVVDSTRNENVRTKADEKKVDARVYAYIVTPQNVLDMSRDDFGELNWILMHEVGRDDKDPISSSGKLIDRYRLWTRTASFLFEVKVLRARRR
jgi:hypothetical protein